MKNLVVHIVDDASWGGVNRLLETLVGASELTHDQHKIVRVERGLRKAPLIEADVIVSHMSACWKNLPFFTSLRATHPETPLVHVEHSYSQRYAALKVKAGDRFSDLLNLTYCLFDRVVAVSEPQAEWIARRGYCQPDQLVTISSCVGLEPFMAVVGRRPTGPFKLACMGRFHEQKGFDIVLEAFLAANPRDIQLVMIGDGPVKDKLQRQAYGHHNVIFKGNTDAPALAMAEVDAVAMPSRWEPYGLVALEAMAAGRAVYCSGADGLKQHVAAGAIAISENTVDGWKALFANGLQRDVASGLRLSAGVAGAEWAFIKAWNDLTHSLTRQTAPAQMAA